MNLQGFGMGFANTLKDRIDDERIRSENLQDEARRTATQVRLRKQAERDSKKDKADELAGSLSLYFAPNEIEAIMQGGVGAAEQALLLGQSAAGKGMSASPLINIPTAAGLSTKETMETADSIVDNASISKISDTTLDLETTGEANKSEQGLFNLDYYGDIMAPADEEQASLDKAYDNAIQKSITSKSKANRDKYKNLAASYLKQIKIKNTAVKEDDKKSSPFSKSTIVSIQRQEIKTALEENDFATDAEGRLLQKVGNKVPEYHTALLGAYSSMKTLNTDNGEAMSPQFSNDINNKVKSSIKKIQLDARRLVANPQDSVRANRLINPTQPLTAIEGVTAGEMLQKNAKAGQYKIGDVVFVQEMKDGIPVTRIKVYTGMALSNMHNNFIDAGTK